MVTFALVCKLFSTSSWIVVLSTVWLWWRQWIHQCILHGILWERFPLPESFSYGGIEEFSDCLSLFLLRWYETFLFLALLRFCFSSTFPVILIRLDLQIKAHQSWPLCFRFTKRWAIQTYDKTLFQNSPYISSGAY